MSDPTTFAVFKRSFENRRTSIWQRIYERHQETIKTKKAKFVLPNIELIISSTIRIANQSSFHSMTLRDLSRDTGISMGALYSYIESKEHLLAMILGEVVEQVEAILDSREADAFDPRQRLRWLLSRHIFLTEVMQPWFFFAYMEAKSFDRSGKRMAIESELRTEGLIASCLVAGQTAGVFRPVDPVVTASLVKPLLQDWYLKRWKYRRRAITPDIYATWVVGFVEAFLMPTESRYHQGAITDDPGRSHTRSGRV